MTCRHAPGDPNCSSHWAHPNNPANLARKNLEQQLKEAQSQLNNLTPDSSYYEILAGKEVNNHLVLKVKYPSCPKCEYEGVKIMVFPNCNAMTALQWKEIDPHFRPSNNKFSQAPSPCARFPGTEDGWNDALEYAERKR